MSDIARYRHPDGTVHYTARGSQAEERLIRDGATDLDAPQQPEVTDAAPAGQGDDHHTGTTDSGSGKRQRKTGTADRGDQPAGEV